MSEPLFDPDKCNVPEVPKLDFDFVSECSIAEPPPPIFDCQPPIVPRDPPPPPCPGFEALVNVRSGLMPGCAVADDPTGAMTVTRTTADPCRFFIDLDLDVPIPKIKCPSFASGVVTLDVDYEGCINPSGAITVTKEVIPGDCKTQDSCKYTIDLDLQIPVPPPPCPEITATGAISVNEAISAPSMAFAVTSSVTEEDCAPRCKFDFNLDIEIPKPCPEIEVSGAISQELGLQEPTMVFTVEKDPDACAFDFGLDILIPKICPEINVSGVIIATPGLQRPSMAFTVEKDPEVCAFDFNLDIEIPDICPEINATGSISATPGLTAPSMAFTVEKDPDACSFDFALDIEIPEVCPEIKVTGSIIKTPGLVTPSMAFAVEKAPDACSFDFFLDIEIPDVCPEITASGTILSTPNLQQPTLAFAVVKDPNACSFDFNLDIEIPDICPEITATGLIIATPGLATPTLAFAVVKDPNACSFDFNLDIEIPDVCPEITATGILIVTPGRNEPTMSFTVIKDPTACSFDFDLEFQFPTARPCPTYTGAVAIYQAPAPTGAIEVFLTPPQAPDEPCFYDINLELGIPVCIPEFTIEHDIKCTPGVDDITCTQFKIEQTGASGCGYLATLDILMPCPRPCPSITGAVTVFEASSPTGALTITHTPPESKTEQCVYDLDLQIGVRAGNTLQTGTIEAEWTVCSAEKPLLSITIDPPDANGVQKLNVDLRIPKWPEYTGGLIDIGSYGSGTITVDATDPCNRTIEGEITLTTTECPSGN